MRNPIAAARTAMVTAKAISDNAETVNDLYTKTRDHITENKNAYVAGVSGLAAGLAIGGAIFHQTGGSNIARQIVIAGKTGNVTQNVTQVLVRRGHPGNIVRCIETGETFASQARAAAVNGIDPSIMSRHLKGTLATAKGLHFENLGDAAALVH